MHPVDLILHLFVLVDLALRLFAMVDLALGLLPLVDLAMDLPPVADLALHLFLLPGVALRLFLLVGVALCLFLLPGLALNLFHQKGLHLYPSSRTHHLCGLSSYLPLPLRGRFAVVNVKGQKADPRDSTASTTTSPKKVLEKYLVWAMKQYLAREHKIPLTLTRIVRAYHLTSHTK